MLYISEQTIKDSIEHYGFNTQNVVCMEECSELTQAISKELRGKHNHNHLIEEIADVYICLDMLRVMYNINEKSIQEWIDCKQERTTLRMKEDILNEK